MARDKVGSPLVRAAQRSAVEMSLCLIVTNPTLKRLSSTIQPGDVRATITDQDFLLGQRRSAACGSLSKNCRAPEVRP